MSSILWYVAACHGAYSCRMLSDLSSQFDSPYGIILITTRIKIANRRFYGRQSEATLLCVYVAVGVADRVA